MCTVKEWDSNGMIKPTPPSKVKAPSLLALPFMYAALLAGMALVQLMGFGGFDFAGIQYETPGKASWIIAIASAEIFALPFLLRLNLSPLARATSAVLALAAPLLILSHNVFMTVEVSLPELVAGTVLGILAIFSFTILDGNRVVKLSR